MLDLLRTPESAFFSFFFEYGPGTSCTELPPQSVQELFWEVWTRFFVSTTQVSELISDITENGMCISGYYA